MYYLTTPIKSFTYYKSIGDRNCILGPIDMVPTTRERTKPIEHKKAKINPYTFCIMNQLELTL